MPFDGKALDVVATTDRARFAADLARHANEPYGVRQDGSNCALAQFFNRTYFATPFGSWESRFIGRYDGMKRQPTGFDCLVILSQIP